MFDFSVHFVSANVDELLNLRLLCGFKKNVCSHHICESEVGGVPERVICPFPVISDYWENLVQ